jgi:hypothetical protein
MMRQLLLLSLARTEEELVPVEVTARAELVALMARILVTVFQTETRRTDERASVQPQDQAGTLGS